MGGGEIRGGVRRSAGWRGRRDGVREIWGGRGAMVRRKVYGESGELGVCGGERSVEEDGGDGGRKAGGEWEGG